MKQLIETSVKRPVTVFMALVALMLMGFISLSRLAIDFLPSMELPFINISTTYDGVGPQEIERSITRVIESAVAGVNNVKNVTSTSSEGRSSVSVEFNWGSELGDATADIREAIDRVRKRLPDGADSPIIMKFSTDMMPVMMMSIHGSDNLAALYELADNQIKNKLEQGDGVGSADIQGGLERKVMVDISLNRLQAYGLNINTVVSLLAQENQNIAGGTTYEGVYKYTLRTTGQFKTLEDVGNIVVSMKNMVPVRLRDLANIYEGYEDETRIVRVNGSPAVMMQIYKESGQNTVQVSKAILKQLNALQLPEGVSYTIFFNASEFIQESISGVVDAAWQGALFAVIILMIYLWNFRTVGVIGISIPISIITTFVIMYFSKITLNIVSLSGLALGIGMMVDNSIVVLENIFYYRETGKGKYSAAIEGTADVALAITASTFTTVAVFIPFLFVEGMTGQMFRDLCLTVTISLLSSLLIALTIVPMLSARMLSTSHNTHFKKVEDFTNIGLRAMDKYYAIVLNKAVKHKKKVLFTVIPGVFIVIAVCMIFIGKEGFPSADEGQFRVRVRMPVGTRIGQTDSFIKRMEADLKELFGSDITTISANTYGNSGNITVKVFKKEDGRKKNVTEYVEEARKKLSSYPGKINVNVQNNMTMGGGGGGMGGGSGDVAIEIVGDDMDRATELGNNIINVIKDIDGVREPQFTREDTNPELVVRINRDLASKMGLNISTIANSIKTGFGGTAATRMSTPTSSVEVDVLVRLEDKDRVNVEDVKRMMIPTAGGMVPISAIASIDKDYGPTAIDRKDNKRVTKITASTYGRTTAEIVTDIQAAIAEKIFIPSDFVINYTGAYQDMQESFAQLIQALLLAVVLVYAIMASQFESYIAPFVISFALPFGAAGALLALLLTRITLSVYSGIGVIVLVGIVINNGIVLIDYMNQLMLKEKLTGDEAALHAGPRRLRPVMMTSLTTILGLLPMALGIGSGNEMYKPLATAILGGLSVSTLFTLVVVPTIYAAIRNKFPLKSYEEKDEISKAKIKAELEARNAKG